jgi:hypothetical protein
VVIQYSHWGIDDDGDEEIFEPNFILVADNGEYFSSLELLYKIHNEVCEKLNNEDHKFLEGIELWEGENPNHPDIPLYFLQQGS